MCELNRDGIDIHFNTICRFIHHQYRLDNCEPTIYSAMLSSPDYLFYQSETGPMSDWPDIHAITETLEVQDQGVMDT
jgi:hypothetical protein